MSITISGFNLKNTITKFQNRDIKSAAAKIINGNGMGMRFIESIGECRSRWLVDYSLYFKAGNFARLFSRLALRIVKVSRNRDDRFFDLSTKIAFRISLHFLQDHGRNFLGSIVFTFYIDNYLTFG